MAIGPCLRATVVAACATALPAMAQIFPAKPIRMLVSFTGGGENNARIIAERATELFGVPVVIEANGAAGGAVAVNNLMRAEPDGYTILYSAAQTLLFRPHLVKNNPYNPLRDMTPIIHIGEATQSVAASATLPANTFLEMIDYAKRNPGRISYATTGIGTTGHLVGALIERIAGINMVHVPYKGGTQSLPDLISGQVQLSFTTLSSFIPMLGKGKIKMLAVTQGGRSERVPDLPTVAELLPGYEVPPGWVAIMGPAKLPAALTMRLADTFIKAANMPEVRKRIADVGTIIRTRTPEEFSATIKRDFEVAGQLIRGAGIEPE
ncbi:MAG: tripartite tricarboxylate transporter substrate binding protein [Betaproteobacteria bacterium]|nr:tripartite tricarboxylate transporter substrate binding protein [Betaproteobacteria bacterium]